MSCTGHWRTAIGLIGATALAVAAAGCGRFGFEQASGDGGAGDDGELADVADGLGDAPPSTASVRPLIGDPGDLFGCSVAISDDGLTLAIGAYAEASGATGVDGAAADNSSPGAGAVYIFVRDGNGWTQQAYLKASNTDIGDVFGFELALSRDGNTLAVGAPDEDSADSVIDSSGADNSKSSAGAVYVFARTGTQWSQQAYIKAANSDASDNFGNAVALSGNGDELVVGAFTEDSGDGTLGDNSATDAGAAYMYERDGGSWRPSSYLKAPNAEAGDLFGADVAISASGDVVAVSATGEASGARGVGGDQSDNSLVQAGAVYTFRRIGALWQFESYLKASNTDGGDFFGYAIALSADGTTLVASAEGEDSNATGVDGSQFEGAGQSGSVYVFARATDWRQQAYIKATNTEADDRFGRSLALSADGDALVVGAVLEDSAAIGRDGDQADNRAPEAGAAYAYRRAGTSWTPIAYLKGTRTESGDQLGNAVAISATGVLALAAWRSDGATDTQPDAGAVYVLE